MPTPHDFALPVINPKKAGYGHPPPGKGRLPGSVNRITKDLKLGIVEAAANLGRDGEGAGGLIGYLEYLGLHHPRAFAGLLGRMLPYQVNGSVASALVGEVRVISVPCDHYLSPGEMEKLQPAPPAIEHTPPSEPVEVDNMIENEPIEAEPKFEEVTAETGMKIIRANRRR